jgi:hypothetical protein
MILFLILLAPVALAGDKGTAEKETHAASATDSDFTLKEVMDYLGVAQAELQLGLLTNNRLMIQHGAAAIADHPKPKGGIKPYLKKNRSKFMDVVKTMDRQVHDTAVEISTKAPTAKMIELQKLNDHMVRGCINCHNVFRD